MCIRDSFQPRALKSGSPFACVCMMDFQGAVLVILQKRVSLDEMLFQCFLADKSANQAAHQSSSNNDYQHGNRDVYKRQVYNPVRRILMQPITATISEL